MHRVNVSVTTPKAIRKSSSPHRILEALPTRRMSTTVKDGETAVGYYIGFDRKQNAEIPIYFRLLQSVVGHAIALGCKRLSLGRTALEPKARLGARPDPMRIWIRHRLPMLNLIVRGLLHTIDDHEEPPQRNPFK